MPSWVERPGRLLRTFRNITERYPHSKQGGDEYEEFHFGERKAAGSGRGGVLIGGEDVLWTAVNFRFLLLVSFTSLFHSKEWRDRYS